MARSDAQRVSELETIAQPRLVTESRNLTLDAFRALADPVRLELLALIAGRGPVCVCHLQSELPYAQPRISKHLAVLRRAGLVRAERRGSWAFYSLDPEAFAAARDFLDDVDASHRRPHLADSCPEPDATG
jgi:ArsR family transcriptional regulator